MRRMPVLAVMMMPMMTITPVSETTGASGQPRRPCAMSDVGDVRVLAILGNNFGWTFFDERDYWESGEVEVDIVSHTYGPTSWVNRPPVATTADYVLSEHTRATVQQYDIVHIQPGAHYKPQPECRC